MRLDQAGHSLGQRGVVWSREIVGLAMGGVLALSRSLAITLPESGEVPQGASVDLLVQELLLALDVMSATTEAGGEEDEEKNKK